MIIPGLIFGIWVSMSLNGLAHGAGDQILGSARLSLIQGEVVLQTPDTGTKWGAASINMPLIPGTKLWAPGGGRLEIQFFGGSYLRGDANTEVDIASLNIGSNGNLIQIGDPEGRTYINYAGSTVPNSVFQVDTPGTSVMAYGPSRFEVDVGPNGYTEVSAINGSIYVQSQTGSTEVPEGSMLTWGPDQLPELSPRRPEDAWLRWNISRDTALAYKGPSVSYLPASLGVYGTDFETYGHWVQTDAYGYVWIPYRVAADWAPYSVGRWCWIGNDYVWVSYEPWGWVPFHYGRWSFVVNIGWCWVPPLAADVYWCPGFVAWISTPTYVAWVPLAPGEIYYGHGSYGRHSVNITNVNINSIQITNNYVNARYVNAVTVVNHKSFIEGRYEQRQRVAGVPANPFREGVKIHPEGPGIKPTLAAALPAPQKVVSQRLLPPTQVVAKAREIEHRPVAANKGVSVFKPGEHIAPMHVNKVEAPRPMTARRPELSQPQQGKEGQGQPSVQGRERGGPSTHRETGIAPQFGSGQEKAPANRPAPNRELRTPSPQRRQTAAPPAQNRAPSHDSSASQEKRHNPPRE